MYVSMITEVYYRILYASYTVYIINTFQDAF
jgi:hypothetical protein